MQEGYAEIRRAAVVNRSIIPLAISRAWRSDPDVRVLLDQVLPDTAAADWAAIAFLSDAQEPAASLTVWTHLIAKKPAIEWKQVFGLIDMLITQERYDDAGSVWRQAVSLHRDSSLVQDDGSLVFDGGFEKDISGGGFGWQQTDIAGSDFDFDTDVKHSGVKLRSIFTGGESLGGELLGWVRDTFGVDAHEVFGQTECNLVIGSNSNLFPIRPGSMGRATPGFDVRIVTDKGEELPRGQRGIIGVRQPCPCTMIEYWKNRDATAKKYAGEFLLTGDLGVQDEDGYFWYVSREDDVITTAGYRVGPSEIEHTLMKHPAVAMSAVVGIPDPIRTESIKAWIVLRPGFAPSDELAREIQEFVKVQLAAHEYPRFVQFADTLPMTATGKVLRRELRALG